MTWPVVARCRRRCHPADRLQYRKWLLDELHRLDEFYRPAHD